MIESEEKLLSIQDIVALKERLGSVGTDYHYFFRNIENLLVNAADGGAELITLFEQYDDDAQYYIYLQLKFMGVTPRHRLNEMALNYMRIDTTKMQRKFAPVGSGEQSDFLGWFEIYN